jgi:hypothetical protein
MSDDDWTGEERARLAALGRTEDPPPELEARVVAGLRERGVIAGPRRRIPWRALAAGLLVFACGLAVGRVTSRGARAVGDREARRFALFLYRGDLSETSGGGEAGRVQEYRQWARGLAAEGRLLAGEKLKTPAVVLGGDARTDQGPSVSKEDLQGFFLIRADTLPEAEALARTCPHLRHGGRIALREIDPT